MDTFVKNCMMPGVDVALLPTTFSSWASHQLFWQRWQALNILRCRFIASMRRRLNLAEGARNELCKRLIDYRFVFSVKGMIQFGAKNTLLAFAPGEMSILYTPEMWRMSRGFVFDPCVLPM
jgi:hypothetical protein